MIMVLFGHLLVTRASLAEIVALDDPGIFQ